jgi:hypothetical protein
MEITPITPGQFPTGYRLRNPNPLAEAVRALEVGDGFSTPCIWSHKNARGTPTGCAGRQTAHQAAAWTRPSIHIRTRCKDGTFYVLRIEDWAAVPHLPALGTEETK